MELVEDVGGVEALWEMLVEVGEVEGGEKKKLSVYVPTPLHNQIRTHAYLTGQGLSEVGVHALRLFVRTAILSQEVEGYHPKRRKAVVKPAGQGWDVADGARLRSGPSAH